MAESAPGTAPPPATITGRWLRLILSAALSSTVSLGADRLSVTSDARGSVLHASAIRSCGRNSAAGPGTAADHRCKGRVNGIWNVGAVQQRTGPSDAGPENRLEIELVIATTFLMKAIARDLSCQEQNRHGVAVRLGYAGQGVRGARSCGGANHARLAADAGVAVGHEGRSLLVAAQGCADAALVQRIVHVCRVRTRHPEHEPHAVSREAVGEQGGGCT